jgi:hypothetical protein
MATATVGADLSVKTENVTYARYIKATALENGTKSYSVKVVRAPEASDDEQMTKDGYTKQAAQTITVYQAGTPDGFAQIVRDEEERVNVWNRGLAQKTQNKINAMLSESNDDGSPTFTFSEDAYDSIDKLNEVTNRRNLSQTDKAKKFLTSSGFTPEQIAAMLAALQS